MVVHMSHGLKTLGKELSTFFFFFPRAMVVSITTAACSCLSEYVNVNVAATHL